MCSRLGYASECGWFGTCVNETCVCNSGWSQSMEFTFFLSEEEKNTLYEDSRWVCDMHHALLGTLFVIGGIICIINIVAHLCFIKRRSQLKRLSILFIGLSLDTIYLLIRGLEHVNNATPNHKIDFAFGETENKGVTVLWAIGYFFTNSMSLVFLNKYIASQRKKITLLDALKSSPTKNEMQVTRFNSDGTHDSSDMSKSTSASIQDLLIVKALRHGTKRIQLVPTRTRAIEVINIMHKFGVFADFVAAISISMMPFADSLSSGRDARSTQLILLRTAFGIRSFLSLYSIATIVYLINNIVDEIKEKMKTLTRKPLEKRVEDRLLLTIPRLNRIKYLLAGTHLYMFLTFFSAVVSDAALNAWKFLLPFYPVVAGGMMMYLLYLLQRQRQLRNVKKGDRLTLLFVILESVYTKTKMVCFNSFYYPNAQNESKNVSNDDRFIVLHESDVVVPKDKSDSQFESYEDTVSI